jgi:hypothetical protein
MASGTAPPVVAHERHGGSLEGCIGTGHAHGDADVGLGKSRGVVHAVADHEHDRSRGLELADNSDLVLGEKAGHVLDGQLSRQ